LPEIDFLHADKIVSDPLTHLYHLTLLVFQVS